MKKKKSLDELIKEQARLAEQQARLAEEISKKSQPELEQPRKMEDVVKGYIKHHQEQKTHPQNLKCLRCSFKDDCLLNGCSIEVKALSCEIVKKQYFAAGKPGYKVFLENQEGEYAFTCNEQLIEQIFTTCVN